MQQLERAILAALRIELKNPKLKMDHVMEWSTSVDAVRKNLQPDKEVLIELADMGISAAVLKEQDKSNRRS